MAQYTEFVPNPYIIEGKLQSTAATSSSGLFYYGLQHVNVGGQVAGTARLFKQLLRINMFHLEAQSRIILLQNTVAALDTQRANHVPKLLLLGPFLTVFRSENLDFDTSLEDVEELARCIFSRLLTHPLSSRCRLCGGLGRHVLHVDPSRHGLYEDKRVLESRTLGGDMEMIQGIGLEMGLVDGSIFRVLAVWSTRKLSTELCSRWSLSLRGPVEGEGRDGKLEIRVEGVEGIEIPVVVHGQRRVWVVEVNKRVE
ncbi:hypothetical protein B0H19DRAFT_1118415 [Mycena capillaripes]|nr:hypothetical protein B0H19DRAFT_1118415 [Mycena capillaripes]